MLDGMGKAKGLQYMKALALMRRSSHPYAAMLFMDWMLSEEGQSLMAQQIPRHQELYKKDFVFVNPAG